ncbi:ROK family transcriptional regulator [Lacrimispora defluvii]|uniref:ROK family protein n=1 Tax=Lacrimispora defluvii TaxID=2719233 RepID=A0ABX1VK22_9FIRM|nr:ROK family protein [Lacrimispora defluvii]NNJ28632.1 ROK family protein [Lacrimispora defluvii]
MKSLEKIKDLTENQCRVIDTLLKKGDITKNEIAEALDMKLTSLNNILYPMKEQGIVIETVQGQPNGGRRPTLYSINQNDYLVIGVDISILYVKVILANIKMEILYKEDFGMDETCTPEKTMEQIAKIIKKIKKKFDSDGERLLGVGIGTVGPLRAEDAVLLENQDFYAAGWKNVRLREMLESKIQDEVQVANGVNCAALLEYLYGSGKNHKNIGYFNCGMGIRVGTIASDKIIRSLNDEEEAFSKMQLFLPTGKQKSNYIEDYITIKAINRKYMELIPVDVSGGENSLPLFMKIVGEAEKEDGIARQVIDEAAEIMGIGLSNFIRLLDIDLIIMGGPLVRSCPRYYEKCAKVVAGNINDKKTQFEMLGKFGNDGIALGAAVMLVENLIGDSY